MLLLQDTDLITRDEDILGGIPVFTGTRVPVQTLLDYLEGGHPLDEFLDHFPTVQRPQAQAVLALFKQALLEPAA
jgi:uncharacterized protein (DUF433 family)